MSTFMENNFRFVLSTFDYVNKVILKKGSPSKTKRKILLASKILLKKNILVVSDHGTQL